MLFSNIVISAADEVKELASSLQQINQNQNFYLTLREEPYTTEEEI